MEERKYTEEYVSIGGIEQYLLHYPGNMGDSVVLYLHGGPGQSYAPYAYYLMKYWNQQKTFVFWDQRGAGKTLSKNSRTEDYPTMSQLIDDMWEVVQHLKKVYKVPNVIIMGHSWGTRLATSFVRKYPQDTQYYISVCQSVEIIESEKRNYQKLYKEITVSKCNEDLEVLEKLLPYPEDSFSEQMTAKTVKLRKLQRKYGLINGLNSNHMSIMSQSPVFSIADMKSMVHGNQANEKLVESLFSESLFEFDAVYEVPVFYILCDHDWELNYTVAEEYFQKIEAPLKHLFILKGCGHIPMLEEPSKFANLLLKIEDVYSNYNRINKSKPNLLNCTSNLIGT